MKKVGLWLMAIFYFGAGVMHFVVPEFYLKIMPSWMPAHLQMVWLSGIAEIILALMLFFDSTRRISAWLIITILSVFFFLIHIPLTVKFHNINTSHFFLNCVRDVLQIPLVAWAWVYTKKRL